MARFLPVEQLIYLKECCLQAQGHYHFQLQAVCLVLRTLCGPLAEGDRKEKIKKKKEQDKKM